MRCTQGFAASAGFFLKGPICPSCAEILTIIQRVIFASLSRVRAKVGGGSRLSWTLRERISRTHHVQRQSFLRTRRFTSKSLPAVWFGSATGMDMAGNFVESRLAIDRRTFRAVAP